MTQMKLAYTVAKGEQGTQRPMHAQRRAERFFRSRILKDLKDQFLEFMNDGFSARLIDEKTKRLVDDLTGSGGVRLDRLGSIRFFVEQEDLFRDISETLRKLPQKDRIADLLARDRKCSAASFPCSMQRKGPTSRSTRAFPRL